MCMATDKEKQVITIRTADGFDVHEGDRVFNYYDGKWGVIERIDEWAQPDTMRGQNSSTPVEEWSNHWFTHRSDDGGQTSLDGSRIAKKQPRFR